VIATPLYNYYYNNYYHHHHYHYHHPLLLMIMTMVVVVGSSSRYLIDINRGCFRISDDEHSFRLPYCRTIQIT